MTTIRDVLAAWLNASQGSGVDVGIIMSSGGGGGSLKCLEWFNGQGNLLTYIYLHV